VSMLYIWIKIIHIIVIITLWLKQPCFLCDAEQGCCHHNVTVTMMGIILNQIQSINTDDGPVRTETRLFVYQINTVTRWLACVIV
jgi:hypothetical protein